MFSTFDPQIQLHSSRIWFAILHSFFYDFSPDFIWKLKYIEKVQKFSLNVISNIFSMFFTRNQFLDEICVYLNNGFAILLSTKLYWKLVLHINLFYFYIFRIYRKKCWKTGSFVITSVGNECYEYQVLNKTTRKQKTVNNTKYMLFVCHRNTENAFFAIVSWIQLN